MGEPLYRDALGTTYAQRRRGAETQRGSVVAYSTSRHEPGFSWEQPLGLLLVASRAAVTKKSRPGSLCAEGGAPAAPSAPLRLRVSASLRLGS